MRRHQLIVAGISLALLIGGAGSPASAGTGQKGARMQGDARTAKAGRVTVDVRQERLATGRLDYRSANGRYKVHCRGFDSYSQRMYIQPGPPAAIVTADCLLVRRNHKRGPVQVEAEFVDNSSFTPGARDEANLTFTLPSGEKVADSGRILSGNITVR